MTQALFYLLPPMGVNTALNDMYQLACRLAQQGFINQQQVYIHCQDKNIAFEIDELLWQFEPSAFVPHNLKGEGPTTGSPVEIGFDRLGPNKSRQLLINLDRKSVV